MKKGIRYLRYSSDGQSNSSIERQDLYTRSWFDRSDVAIIDTFIDEGYSARTFDRPDFKKLQEFIAKNHRHVDYLVVDQMDRFSRDAGQALTMIKQLQKKYAIQIVSANDGLIYDHNTPGSLLRTGLQFLLAEENNIDRQQKIRAGIYTAKAKEGRYIGPKAPFGYRKEGVGKARGLVIDVEQAPVIRHIYDQYLAGTPLNIIHQQARELGFKGCGNSIMSKILMNPIYAGHQYVEPHKHLHGGLFKAIHEPIIDMHTWQLVQQQIRRGNAKKILDEDFPLRGFLKCHCSLPVTGAKSKGKAGKWYGYYKCKKAGHNNFSSNQAHAQMEEILDLLSLPDYITEAICTEVRQQYREQAQVNAQLADQRRKQLEAQEKKLISLEEKWINDQVSHETYQRWYTDITNNRISLKAEIEVLTRDVEEAWMIHEAELEKLTDLRYLYNSITIPQRHELLGQVFDNGLYYQDRIYRTPYLMQTFTHNALTLKHKSLLVIDGWDYENDHSPLKWS